MVIITAWSDHASAKNLIWDTEYMLHKICVMNMQIQHRPTAAIPIKKTIVPAPSRSETQTLE